MRARNWLDFLAREVGGDAPACQTGAAKLSRLGAGSNPGQLLKPQTGAGGNRTQTAYVPGTTTQNLNLYMFADCGKLITVATLDEVA